MSSLIVRCIVAQLQPYFLIKSLREV